MDPEELLNEAHRVGDIEELFPSWMSPPMEELESSTPILYAADEDSTQEIPVVKQRRNLRRRIARHIWVFVRKRISGLPRPQGFKFSMQLSPDMEKSLRRYLLIAISTSVGFIVGLACMAPLTRQHTVTDRVTVTVTTPAIAVPGPTQTIVAVPESCQAAIQYQAELEPYVKQIIDVGGPASDDLQQAYVAVATKDVSAINAAIDKLNKLQDGMTQSAQAYLSLLDDSAKATAACLKDANN